MTARFERRVHGTGHSYRLDGAKIPGVTTVIDALAKPALTQWAANMAADYVTDQWADLEQMTPSERRLAVSQSHRRRLKTASVRGTRIHALGEQLAHGLEVDVPPEYAGPVNAYARFLDRWQIETVITELPVCHPGYRYGGTADLLGRSPLLNDGRCSLMDVKTGKGVYRETALQLAGYRAAPLALEAVDVVGPRGGKSVRWDEVSTVELFDVDDLADVPELAYVAHVTEDDVELLPVDAGPRTFAAFLYALGVHRWISACSDDPPVGRAIWPETLAAEAVR